jgi:hypothetical protein
MELGVENIFATFLKMMCFGYFLNFDEFSRATQILYRQTDSGQGHPFTILSDSYT